MIRLSQNCSDIWLRGREHVRAIESMAADFELPHISPWEYGWSGESPETIEHQNISYLMRPRDALMLALSVERRAALYYRGVVECAENPQVLKLATRLHKEEVQHVALLMQWLELSAYAERNERMDDLDPPNPLE